VADPHARRGLPDRWLLPPAPRDPRLRDRWLALGFEQRRALARVRPGAVAALSAGDVEVVEALARARLATSWRLLVSAPVVGWLAFMTVWGFGRSAYPASGSRWLLAGAAIGGAVWLVAAVSVARRLRRARHTLTACATLT
jgi:hypothetical protein